MNIEEKLELLDRMRKESARNEYRLHYGKTLEEEPVEKAPSGEEYQYSFRFRLILSLFLFLIFCGLLLSGDARHKKISEEILNCLQKDFIIGYNDTINLEEMLPEFLHLELK